MNADPDELNQHTRSDCALIVNVGQRDYAIAARTLPHLLRTHCAPFAEILVLIDPSATSGRLAGASSAGDEPALHRALADVSPAPRVLTLDRTASTRRNVNREWFGRANVADRCAGGTPIYPFIFGLCSATSKYRLHVDCDMLIHDPGPRSWVEVAISTLQREHDVLFVNQMMGPNSDQISAPEFLGDVIDGRGIRLSQRFSTRCFLYDADRLGAVLPMRAGTHTFHKRVLYRVAGRSGYLPFERMVESHLRRMRLFRCDLDARFGFSIHCWNKQFFLDSAIDETIKDVEAGLFPSDQRGHINLTRVWRDL